MQREKWYYDFMGDLSLLDVAMDLHGIVLGWQEDSTENPRLEMNVKCIRHALDTWVADIGSNSLFSDAVKNLLYATIREYECKSR